MSTLRKLSLTLFATSALGLCLSCGGGEKAHDDHDGHDHAGETAAPAANLAGAGAFYTQSCTPCHGPTGKGDGPAAAAFPVKPRDLSDKAWQDSVDDTYITKVITEGGAAVGKDPLMVAFGPAVEANAEINMADVVAYVRSLGK